MNNNLPNQKEPPICFCTGTTEAKIKQLIAKNVNTLERIADMTGATTGCGACEYEVLELIKQSTLKEDE